jgi:predicted ferric reductase
VQTITFNWYLIRVSGIVSVALLLLIIISGIGQVTGWTYRFMPPVRAWLVHKILAYSLVGAVALHIFPLLIDKFHPATLIQLFVPFLLQYNNSTTFLGLPLAPVAVGFGVVSIYLMALIILSSLKWNTTKPRLWGWIHYSSYLLMALIFVHVLYTGSDVKESLGRGLWILAGIIILIATALRLWRAGTLRRKR